MSYVCGTLALIGLFLQIKSDSDAKRAESSLSYVHQYYSDPLSSHRQSLAKAWLPYRQELATVNAHGGLRSGDIDKLVEQVLTQYDSANPGQPTILSVNELASFFDQMLTCVQVGACDRKIIHRYFSANIADFWSVYRHQIARSRASDSSSLGLAIETHLKEGK